jgi:hypothetical protein
MFNRTCLNALLLAGLALPLTSCISSPSLTSITVTPGTYTSTLAASGCPLEQTNFTATGYYTHPDHPPVAKNITSQVTWASLTPEMVTISTSGVATVTCQLIGNTSISASAPGFGGDIVGYATYNVVLPTTASVVTPKAGRTANGM